MSTTMTSPRRKVARMSLDESGEKVRADEPVPVVARGRDGHEAMSEEEKVRMRWGVMDPY
jgi:hypothetical protein